MSSEPAFLTASASIGKLPPPGSAVAELLRTYYGAEAWESRMDRWRVWHKSSLCAVGYLRLVTVGAVDGDQMSSSVEITNCAFDYIVETLLAAASAEGHLDSGVLVVLGCGISSDGRAYFNQHRSESEGVSYFTAEAMDDLVDILRKRLLRLLEKMQVLQVLASVAVFSDSAGSSTQSPLSRSVAATRCDPTFRAIRNILCLCDVHA
ncbi:Mitochondrial import inner membrane translocase subunit TIM44, variant 2 [Perkinsus olseni]|uniref:Mitochondrial import inner membrane translocase subunit TIM44, variant 2 n=1 Tax=Perkinsus olseni TaxID=32597 RepID=A0A7J6S650_PEROL|nr:Mitochondrial import inner membrane translocase subunit TIM44, variant 2 [Perkinsus olseni]